MRIGDVAPWIFVEERLALFAVLALGVVHTVVANAAAHEAGRLVDGAIEVAASGVLIAIAPTTFVPLITDGRSPRQVVEEVLTLFAVKSLRRVSAFATTVNLKYSNNQVVFQL